MRKRRLLSFSVTLFLLVGTVAPLLVQAKVSLLDTPSLVHIYEAFGDDVDQPKRKGKGFARSITAPFRAIGRLFGSGRKKSSRDAAKKQPQAPSRTEVANSGGNVSQSAESRRTNASTSASESPVAPASVPKRGAGVSVVRPTEGQAAVVPKTPKWIPVIEGIGRDPLSQGRALLQHGYVNEAISELSVAATIGPDLVEANNLLGLAYDRLGEHRQAVEAYERALSVAPDNPQILNNLGYALSLGNNQREALKRLKQAARRAPGAPYILNNIALVEARMGKFGDAFKSFKRAFGEYDARIKTAELLEQAGRFDEAIKHYAAAIKIDPNSPALLERLAELYDRTGRQREAEATRRTLGNPPNKQKTATGGGGG